MTATRSEGRPLRRALTSVVPLLLAVLTVPVAAPAHAASGRCDPGTGVTVVVDFGSLGRGVELGCDPSGAGKQASQVVPRAGFQLTYVNGQPFVCRIDGLPGSSEESCSSTPPEDAYWALYWSDGRDGRWVYASSGVASLDVPKGGSIGFRWQNSDARALPGAPPTTGAPPKPEPTKPPKPPKPTPEPSKAPVTPSQSAAPTASAAPAGTPSDSPSAAKKAEKAEKAERAEKRAGQRADKGERAQEKVDRKAAAREDRRATRRAVADDEQVAAESAAQEETPLSPASAADEGSGPLTWLAGGAVLLLAAAAGVLARRRRG